MSLPDAYQKLVVTAPNTDLRSAVQAETIALEPPKADEIVIKTHYTGVNAADYMMAAGRYVRNAKPPFDLGAESVGVIAAVGEAVTDLKVGDAVMSIEGGYREYFTIKAQRAIPIPEAAAEYVTLGVSGLTASIALDELGDLHEGETTLVTAAAGGTGVFAVQLAKLAGNTVIGTCSTDEKAEFLRSIGCDRPINYKTEEFKAVLRDEFPQGINVVYESVGGAMYDTALNALATKGRMIAIGAISEYKTGPEMVTRPRVLYTLLGKSASLRGFWLPHYLREASAHLQKLTGLIESGQLKLFVDPAHFTGVTGAIEALDYMFAGKNIGKVVVDFTA